MRREKFAVWNRKKIFGTVLALLLLLPMLIASAAAAETATSEITMAVSSSCYIYRSASAASQNRADYVTFGQELEVDTISGEWATIQYNGATRYIKRSNLDYLKETVIKNRVMVSPGAYACSESTALGYVFYGTEVSVLGEHTKKGVTYLHCLLTETYSADGTVKRRNVEGYINAAYLAETATPKIVNSATNLYASAYGSASAASAKTPVGRITTGEEVQMLLSNATWSKIRYQGEEYYISTNRLDSKTMQIMVGRVMQTADAKPGSGYLHYFYWNKEITVLNTYESDVYGTYYYCKYGSDYGFVRERVSGVQYVGYTTKMQITGATKLYALASSTSSVVKSLPAGTEVTVQYTSDNWARVETEGTVGYVSANKLAYPTYLANGAYFTSGYDLYRGAPSGTLQNETVSLVAAYAGRKYAYVLTQEGTGYWMKSTSLVASTAESTVYTAVPSVTLHTAQSAASSGVSVPYMTQLTLMETYDNTGAGAWSKVRYQDTVYYLWQETGSDLLTETKSNFTYTGNTQYQQAVLDLALAIYRDWPTRYAHGESNGQPASDGSYGFDCSGFAAYVLNQTMQTEVPCYRVSADLTTLYQTTGIYNAGYPGAYQAETVIPEGGALDESSLQPGDLLFFNLEEESDAQITGTGYNHCGIYLGKGEFIQCTHSWGGGVCIMPLKGIYVSGFVAARRYLPTAVTAAGVILYTTGQKTNVYAAEDSTATPVDVLSAETAVTLLYTDNGNWTYVSYENGKEGYLLKQSLTSTIPVTEETRYVAVPSLKLYTQNSTSAQAVQVLIGTEVTYRGQYSNSSYYKVSYNGGTYFVYAPKGIDTVLLDRAGYSDLLEGGTPVTLSANASLREAPSNDGAVIRVVKAGESFTIIAANAAGDSGKAWVYGKDANGVYGFLFMMV
jgi:cell wall-associated NlpC family hydrolase